MAYPSSVSDYWHSVQWGSLTHSLPTSPRACLSAISASSFCCLPYLPFWPFSRFTDYSDLDVDDNISTSSSTWQPPSSALNALSSSTHSSFKSAAARSVSTALRVSQPVAQPVFSSHLASSTFTSPDQLSSLLVRQQDAEDSRLSAEKDRRRQEDDTAARALTNDMRKSRDNERSGTSHKHAHSRSKSTSKKQSHRESAGRRDRRAHEESARETRPPSRPHSALSSSPVSLLNEDMSDSDLSDLSSDDDEALQLDADRHERALGGSGVKPTAIY